MLSWLALCGSAIPVVRSIILPPTFSLGPGLSYLHIQILRSADLHIYYNLVGSGTSCRILVLLSVEHLHLCSINTVFLIGGERLKRSLMFIVFPDFVYESLLNFQSFYSSKLFCFAYLEPGLPVSSMLYDKSLVSLFSREYNLSAFENVSTIQGFYHVDMSYIFSEFPVLQKSLQP